jgi:hypothetical protein
MDPNSYPKDSDYDMIPDAVDDDDDNDGWPDSVEQDRGSDPLDPKNTPFNNILGITTGTFYHGGLEFDTEYDAEAIELSLSGLSEVVTEELVIPLLLIPVYFYFFYSRRRLFEQLKKDIDICPGHNKLNVLEKKINRYIEDRKIKTHHGLILRNRIEERENDIRGSEEE